MFIIVRHWKYLLFSSFFFFFTNKCLVYTFVTVQIFLYGSRKDCWEKQRGNSDLEKVQLKGLSCCSKKTNINSSASVARLIQHWGNLDALPAFVCTPVSPLQIKMTVKRLNMMKNQMRSLSFLVEVLFSCPVLGRLIVMPTMFQALDKTTPQPKKINFSSHFWSFLTVWLLVSFCSLKKKKKGLPRKFADCVSVSKYIKSSFFLF